MADSVNTFIMKWKHFAICFSIKIFCKEETFCMYPSYFNHETVKSWNGKKIKLLSFHFTLISVFSVKNGVRFIESTQVEDELICASWHLPGEESKWDHRSAAKVLICPAAVQIVGWSLWVCRRAALGDDNYWSRRKRTFLFHSGISKHTYTN